MGFRIRSLCVSCVVVLFVFLISPSRALAQCAPVREIPALQLNDIAMASFDQLGVVIYFNPAIIQQSGPLVSAYFKAHEYGHVCLGHVQQMAGANPFLQMWLSPHLELQADCYAAKALRNTNPAALQAGIQRLQSQGPIQHVPTHPAGTVRAQTIINCMNTP